MGAVLKNVNTGLKQDFEATVVQPPVDLVG